MRIWCTILFYSAVMLGCVDDAPRDNPLDPLSPKYTGRGSMTGRAVIGGLAMATGIEGMIVSHLESGTFVMTDSMGYFTFNNLPLGMQHFACAKQNFTGDTFQVQIQSHPPANTVWGFNGAPVVLSQKIFTRKIDYVSLSPEYSVDIVADVTDPNGFTNLEVWFNAGDSLFPMKYDLEKFIVSLKKIKFPTNTIQWLTGKPLYIVSRDEDSATSVSEPFYISRIIENASTPLSPVSSDTISFDSLVFKWRPQDVTFLYSSIITVYEGGTEAVIWTSQELGSTIEDVSYPKDGSALPLVANKSYFWTVTIVDEFGNTSRSKESYFRIQ